MASALRIYGDGLCRRTPSEVRARARLRDGTTIPLALDRWLGPADVTDERVLDGLDGPVLDVGCGPGRHLHALAARGVFALGVDLSPVAVALAIGGGGRAIVGDIFDDLPGAGSWRSALLLDGNIGIGGAPVRLLTRLGALLDEDGAVLVEVEPPAGRTYCTQARIESAGLTSGWFPWARVAAPGIAPLARRAGFAASAVWSVSGRCFARLDRNPPVPIGTVP
ncbi:MAG: class I SAM-dependent methyltransferase [Solirubrobacteraceae bacterium]